MTGAKASMEQDMGQAITVMVVVEELKRLEEMPQAFLKLAMVVLDM